MVSWCLGMGFLAWSAGLGPPAAGEGERVATRGDRSRSAIERWLIEGAAIARPRPRGVALDDWLGSDAAGDSDESDGGEGDLGEFPNDPLPLRDELEVLP